MSCDKRRYFKKEHARMQARIIHPGQRMRVYKCKECSRAGCNIYHLTSKNAAYQEYWRSQ